MHIVFDIGGTKTRIAGSRNLDTFSTPVVFETPKNFSEFVGKFRDAALLIAEGEKIQRAAGDAAGPFMEDRSTLFRMPSIPEWGENILIRKALEDALEAPAQTVNDAALVGLGEAVYGAGRGHEIVVYMTVSTGVGGARIVNGEIDDRVYGFEPGWQVIDADGTLSPEENKSGYLIDFISGRAVEKQTGKKPFEIHDEAYWDKLAGFLACGLNNTILHWSPHVLVLGGSMMKEVGIHIPDVEKHLKKIMHIYPTLPEIKHAELDDFGGLYGALAFLKR
ncbi:MAG TPA: ROK family protein [Candidatus Paceibacterota bacterium]|nr:ROK family protein [Candidatus Paceibacterota bacterium]